MDPRVSIRLMTPADIPFADSLRALAGWNQTPADWQRFLSLAPTGCFVAECNGKPAGTATTVCHGVEVAWIGMVLVHPEQRRKGVGTVLLEHCIQHLRQTGMRCIKLDATPLGQPLYEKLGFQSEWTLSRWERAAEQTAPETTPKHIRPWELADGVTPTRLDRRAFGVSRWRLLWSLALHSNAIVHETPKGAVSGFGMTRTGARATYLGPVIATNNRSGDALVQSLVQRASPSPLFWDIPDTNTKAVKLAEDLGFKRQRQLVRMFLGQNKHPGRPELQYAITAPETG